MDLKFQIVCDIQERLAPHLIDDHTNFGDHPLKENIDELMRIVKKCGFECDFFGGVPELIQAINQKQNYKDTIFLNLTDGLDLDCGRLQAPILLETLGVAYSGANPFQTALINDKYYTKLAVQDMGILIPDSIHLKSSDIITNKELNYFQFPVIVKPNGKGSSLGITQKSVCFDIASALQQIEYMRQEFDDLLIEQFIPGYEVTDFVIGNKNRNMINMPVLEEFHGNLIHLNEVMAIEDKAYRTRTFHDCSMILGIELAEQIKKHSLIIKNGLYVNDILRIDYRVTQTGQIYFLEANTVPHFSSKNEAGFVCQLMRQPYDYFISSLLETVAERVYLNR